MRLVNMLLRRFNNTDKHLLHVGMLVINMQLDLCTYILQRDNVISYHRILHKQAISCHLAYSREDSLPIRLSQNEHNIW